MKSSDGADAAAPPQPIAKPSRPARRPFSRKKLWLFRLTALAVGLMLSFLLAEMLLRVVQREDADGNVTVFGRHVGPVRPPVHRIRETLRQYTETSNSRMIYNPHTGWSARPGRCFRDGRYCYNSAGLRSAPREYSQAPPPGTLRIALFGDSFTHGDDVAWPETWAAQLEAELNQRGVTAEVLNFGLSAAGMDQALLYWQSLGIRYQPHVVLFGFQSENVGRNVNLLRGLYAPGSGIPFSKPRFVLQHDGTIEPVNVPAAPPEQVPGILANLEAWPLTSHEWFYRPSTTCPLERWSRVWQLFSTPQPVSRSRWSSRVLYDPNGEPARVTLGILNGQLQRPAERSSLCAGHGRRNWTAPSPAARTTAMHCGSGCSPGTPRWILPRPLPPWRKNMACGRCSCHTTRNRPAPRLPPSWPTNCRAVRWWHRSSIGGELFLQLPRFADSVPVDCTREEVYRQGRSTVGWYRNPQNPALRFPVSCRAGGSCHVARTTQ